MIYNEDSMSERVIGTTYYEVVRNPDEERFPYRIDRFKVVRGAFYTGLDIRNNKYYNGQGLVRYHRELYMTYRQALTAVIGLLTREKDKLVVHQQFTADDNFYLHTVAIDLRGTSKKRYEKLEKQLQIAYRLFDRIDTEELSDEEIDKLITFNNY